MVCKYCFQKNHFIQDCPNIKCKICNDTGHAHWLCKKRDLKVLFDSQLQQLQKLYNNNNSSLLQQIEYLKNMDKLINND